MTRNESYALAEAMLAKAGWFPHPEWGTYCRENLVFGIQPDRRGVHVKDFTKIPPGHPLYSVDTPDEPHEAAAWLIAKFSPAPLAEPAKAEESAPDVQEPVREEVRGPAEASPGAVDSGDESAAAGDAGRPEDGPADQGGDLLADDGSLGQGDSDVILDADYLDAEDAGDLLALGPPDDPLLEGADAEFPALDAEPEDFAPDKIEPDDVAAGVAIFGDNLPMQRLLLIGRVTQKAAEIKAILQDGWTVEEFASLQNLIMRIDQGLAPDDEHARARFTALSEASRAMSAVDAYADAQVAFLNEATREQIDSYDPEAGWP